LQKNDCGFIFGLQNREYFGFNLDTMKQILIIGRKIDNTYKYIVLVEAGVGIQTLNKVFEKKLLGDLSFHRFQT